MSDGITGGKLVRMGGLALCLFFLVGLMTPSTAQAQAKNCGGDVPVLEDGSCSCTDEAFAESLRKAAESRAAIKREVGRQVLSENLKAYTEEPIKFAFGDLKISYCIDRIYFYFDTIAKIIAGDVAWIVAAVQRIVQALLEMICRNISTIIDNALDRICIPWPSLQFDVSFNSVARRTCDGIGLTDLIRVEPAPLFDFVDSPRSYKTYPASRWMGEGRF